MGIQSLEYQLGSAKWNKVGWALPLLRNNAAPQSLLTSDFSFWNAYRHDSMDADLAWELAEYEYYNAPSQDTYMALLEAEDSARSANKWEDSYAMYWLGDGDLGNMLLWDANEFDYDLAEEALWIAEKDYYMQPTYENGLALELAELSYEAARHGKIRGIASVIPSLGNLLGGNMAMYQYGRQNRLGAEIAAIEAELAEHKFMKEYGTWPMRGYGHHGLYGGLF